MIALRLSKCLSEANRVTKVFTSPNDDIVLEGTIKKEQDLLKPVFVVETDVNLKDYNYCEIPGFGRKYFMHPHVQQTHLWILELEVDVLSTYATGLANCPVLVKRTCKDGKMNFYINDDVFFTEQRNIVTYHNFKKRNPTTGELVDATFGSSGYYLIVAGG